MVCMTSKMKLMMSPFLIIMMIALMNGTADGGKWFSWDIAKSSASCSTFKNHWTDPLSRHHTGCTKWMSARAFKTQMKGGVPQYAHCDQHDDRCKIESGCFGAGEHDHMRSLCKSSFMHEGIRYNGRCFVNHKNRAWCKLQSNNEWDLCDLYTGCKIEPPTGTSDKICKSSGHYGTANQKCSFPYLDDSGNKHTACMMFHHGEVPYCKNSENKWISCGDGCPREHRIYDASGKEIFPSDWHYYP